jgi:hypothetical protein
MRNNRHWRNSGMHITFIFADTMSVIETTVVVVSIIKMRDNDEHSLNVTRAWSIDIEIIYISENFSKKEV